jgi:hypothetical protein
MITPRDIARRPNWGKASKLIYDLTKIVLGAGLEPASLSAYAPQTYVSANSTTRALNLGMRQKFSLICVGWQPSLVPSLQSKRWLATAIVD